jgi:hypothetical protein
MPQDRRSPRRVFGKRKAAAVCQNRYLSKPSSLASKPTREPASDHDPLAYDEERSENRLVVLCQPIRKVNVAVGLPFSGVFGCQIGQGTSASVGSEQPALKQDDDGYGRSPTESTEHSSDEQDQNASRQKRPGYGVQQLNRGKH